MQAILEQQPAVQLLLGGITCDNHCVYRSNTHKFKQHENCVNNTYNIRLFADGNYVDEVGQLKSVTCHT